MKFPSQTSHNIGARTLDEILDVSSTIGVMAQRARALCLAGTGSDSILAMQANALRLSGNITEFKDLPGIGAYAADNLIPSITANDLVTAADAVIAALDAVVDYIEVTFPHDQVHTDPLYVDHVLQYKTWTPAQLSALAGLLQNVVDAVETI